MPDAPADAAGLPQDKAGAALAAALRGARGRRAEALVHETERLLVPAEYLDLADALAREGHPLAAVLAARPVRADLLRSRRPPEPYRRDSLGEEALFFGGPGPSGGKTLVIGFAGLRGRLGMPTACLLQRLDARRHDLLLLHDGARLQFRTGCRGLSRDLPGLVAAVAARVGAGGYARRVAIGYSIGALPAAQFGVLAGVDRIVAIGARPRDDALRLAQRQAVPTAFDPLCACLARRPRQLLFVHAEHHAVDRACAARLAAGAGGVAVAVRGLDSHGLIDALWVRGALDSFLAAMLHGPMPASSQGAVRYEPGRLLRLRHALRARLARWRRRPPTPPAAGPAAADGRERL